MHPKLKPNDKYAKVSKRAPLVTCDSFSTQTAGKQTSLKVRRIFSINRPWISTFESSRDPACYSVT
jgi:hypothetical protein